MSAAILDEDELLGLASNEPVDVLDYGLDEELLLGPGCVSRTTTLEYESEIPSKPDADSDLIGNDPSTTFEDAEKEELDYEEDEEEEREERVGKFTSERKQHNENSKAVESLRKTHQSGFSGGAQRGSYQYRGRGLNNRQNRGGMNRFIPGNVSGLPSLMNMPLGMGPPFNGMGPGISMNGQHGKILINPNFQQQQPLVRLNIPGIPTITMPPPPLPMNPMQQNGPIIPRLPNGIPLLPTNIQGPPIPGISGMRPLMLPQNHGMAGFGSPPGINSGLPATNGPIGSWDQAVHQFLSQPPANASGRFKPSRRRSRSSSYSSGSSYSGSSRSRSRSRSPRRHRREDHRKSDRDGRKTQRARGGRDATTYRGSRGGNNNYRKNDSRSHNRRNDKMVTEECAKAVGVDNDYLSRMAEQRRQREEIMRKKEQRRTGGEDEKETKEVKKQPSESAHAFQEKLKPCLCVHAKGLKQLTTARAKIEAIAKEIGHVKKCWQWDDDQITVVFADLNHAKEFTMKYNGKVLSGLRMAVTMTKEYLNLNNLR